MKEGGPFKPEFGLTGVITPGIFVRCTANAAHSSRGWRGARRAIGARPHILSRTARTASRNTGGVVSTCPARARVSCRHATCSNARECLPLFADWIAGPNPSPSTTEHKRQGTPFFSLAHTAQRFPFPRTVQPKAHFSPWQQDGTSIATELLRMVRRKQPVSIR